MALSLKSSFGGIVSDATIEETTLRDPIAVKKGSILKRYRVEKSLTQREVAYRIEVSPGWLSGVETGRTASPGTKHLEDLVYELDRNMTGFFKEVEESVMRASDCIHCGTSFGKPHACMNASARTLLHRKSAVSLVKGRKLKRA